MRDLHNNIVVQKTVTAQVATTDKTGTVVDGQGYGSVEHIASVGASGDTLSGSVKIDLKLQHGDESDGSDMAAVAAADVIGGTPDENGIFATIDDGAEDDVVHSIGYIGTKRYSRLVFDLTGTHTNGTPVSAVAVKGHPAQAPTT